ncbi:MAG: type I pantothenate kinase [Propionicimonas sp.]|uniref:type I pantothenate kinase n=1 Tax=Propionicimonas sp. TaxID=1955623 RepID=UPI002B20AEFF|nr:type I pantothenate kinase [Propionicimonas sp.]MEA4943256.1 type I pantothenate kinase [Propionicimonas sp.]MEA5119277.1 type I pantothenate kinase [Propionicimonas sp.]
MSSPAADVPAPEDDPFGPYVTLDRGHWSTLAEARHDFLEAETIARLRGVNEPMDFDEVSEVYLPLTELIQLYMDRTGELSRDFHRFLGLNSHRTPFLIGVAGSVAVGKSTTSRLLKELLSRAPGHPQVDLVTTDGFLLPNATLQKLGLLDRKGFPESYDRRRLLRFVMDVKSGKPEVTAPVYSHLAYDIVPDEQIVVRQPDILIIEGLNVLQPARRRSNGMAGLAVSDFFDFSVYVDADDDDVRTWYLNRFRLLRQTAFRDPRSYFAQFAAMDEADAIDLAGQIWDTINGPNLLMNILPTRGRATAILRKAADHKVSWVRIRRI